MIDTERRIGYVELGEKLDSMNGRLQKLEEKVTSINVVVENNLAGERSVWAAIEKLTHSIEDSNRKQSEALEKAVQDANRAIEASEKDRAELHKVVSDHSADMKILTNTYASMSGWLKAIGVMILTSMLGIVVGLLTHSIQIPWGGK